MTDDQVDKIISKLLSVKQKPEGTSACLTQAEMIYIIKTIRPIFLEQPNLLELRPPITICGDIHGQYHDLLRIFEIEKYPPLTNYLFLGDYVDRGRQSIETICLLFCYKIKYTGNFFLLRGNHECLYINRQYGFYDEMVTYFSVNMWRLFCDVFKCMPVAAVIEDKIFCIHGGISPLLSSLDDIKEMQRPVEIPENGLLCDLLWSDPCTDPDADPWTENPRGTSFSYSVKPIHEFLEKNDFDLLCRAHQAIIEGYEFPFPDQCVVTIFSAANYCYEYQNKGAIMRVDENLLCTFAVLEPVNWDEEYFVGPRPGTPPRNCQEVDNNSPFFH